MAVKRIDQLLIDLLHDSGAGDIPNLISVVNRRVSDLAKKRTWRFYEDSDRITVLPAYSTGTVTVTLDSATVTGDSTVWTAAMVGRRFQCGAGYFLVATRTSNTEITIDQPWPGATASGQSYSIFQDTYTLPSDISQLLEIVDSVTQLPLEQAPWRDGLREWFGYGYTNLSRVQDVVWPWRYAQWGIDSTSDVPQIRLNAVGAETRYLDVYYYRNPVAVTAINGVPDITESMQEALYQMVLLHYFSRRNSTTEIEMNERSRRLTEIRAAFQSALYDAILHDNRLTTPRLRNKRVLV